jgi:CheY-like chemotaxis protein
MIVTLLVLVVDDEPDVEVLFRQQFRRDLGADRFTMEFAQSAPKALQRSAMQAIVRSSSSCPTSTCRG